MIEKIIEGTKIITKRLWSDVVKPCVMRRRDDTECPCYWWERGLEDCDEGCRIGRLQCGSFVHCYYPVFMKALLRRWVIKSEERHFAALSRKAEMRDDA